MSCASVPGTTVPGIPDILLSYSTAGAARCCTMPGIQSEVRALHRFVRSSSVRGGSTVDGQGQVGGRGASRFRMFKSLRTSHVRSNSELEMGVPVRIILSCDTTVIRVHS